MVSSLRSVRKKVSNSEFERVASKYCSEFDLDCLGYSLQPGHRLSVSVSTGYWPAIWPGAEVKTVLIISRGSVQLPVMGSGESRAHAGLEEPPAPVLGPPLVERVLKEPKYERFLQVGLSNHVSTVIVRDYRGRWHGTWDSHQESTRTNESISGNVYTPSCGTRIEESEEAVYTIEGDNPLSARAEIGHEIQMEFAEGERAAEGENVHIATLSEMSCSPDGNSFILRNKLTTKLNGSVFFEREWNDEVNRLIYE